MPKPTPYAEKLRDPRWQRKRLEVLQRDDFTCRYCGAKDKTLHVHHLAYERGRDPWEYEAEELLTLCETCHEEESRERPAAERYLLNALRRAGVPWDGLNALADGFDASEGRMLAAWIMAYALRPNTFPLVCAVVTKASTTGDLPEERERWWAAVRPPEGSAGNYPEWLPKMRDHLQKALADAGIAPNP